MQAEWVLRHLEEYHRNRQRVKELRKRNMELNLMIRREKESSLAAISLPGSMLTGLPSGRGGTAHSVVEDTAIRYADGYESPLILELKAERADICREMDGIQRAIDRVDGWLGEGNEAMTDREKLVIRLHSVDHISWRELSLRSGKLLGAKLSESGLRRIGKAAMWKLYQIAT